MVRERVREEPDSPWVEFPMQIAMASYRQHRQQYAQQAVFASGATKET